MFRLGVLFLAVLALSACTEAPPDEGPYAPGVDIGGEHVDPLIVGHRLMDAGEYDLAINAYSRAVAIHGLTPEILTGIGTAHLGLGQLGTAERMLRNSIEQNERSPETWNNLGVVLMEKNEFGEAEQVFRRAYALDNGESDSIRDNLTLALAKLENLDYGEPQEQEEYKVIRSGSSEFLIRKNP